jgi:hypothetical protein
VMPVLKRLQELAPVVYANGTLDKAAILIHFPEQNRTRKR